MHIKPYFLPMTLQKKRMLLYFCESANWKQYQTKENETMTRQAIQPLEKGRYPRFAFIFNDKYYGNGETAIITSDSFVQFPLKHTNSNLSLKLLNTFITHLAQTHLVLSKERLNPFKFVILFFYSALNLANLMIYLYTSNNGILLKAHVEKAATTIIRLYKS